jgi:subtilase family serine protease
MRHRPVAATLAVLSVGLGLVAVAQSGSGAAGARVTVQTASPIAVNTNLVGPAAATATVDFDVALQLTNHAGAVALEQAVSDPTSASYRHFLTPAQWESRFSPSPATVSAVTSWLQSDGLTVDGVSQDRMTVAVSGTTEQVAAALGTTLDEYRHLGQVVRLAATQLSVPADLSGVIGGITGVDQVPATHDSTIDAAGAPAAGTDGQPGGFRVAPPCSGYYGQVSVSGEPGYGDHFPHPLAYAPCGYNPTQLESAYGISSDIANGIDGRGVTVAVVDAYASPSIFADAHKFSRMHQPGHALAASQFDQTVSPTFNQQSLCGPPGWYGEETLDVEAVHAMAPGANILYVGAENCLDSGLLPAEQQIVDGHLADIITNSWGDNGGDLLDPAGTRLAYDNVFLMAGGTGIGIQFSAGDNGDEFATVGMTVADYPSSSPYVTSVGGTGLQVGAAGERLGELGWSTSKSVLCTTTLAADRYPGCTAAKIRTYLPAAPGAYDYGGGGGTSFVYPEPSYQTSVVPAALAGRNAFTGVPMRVEPDISMDADPTTGMLVGETQRFPAGTFYGEYRIGGTSVSSPLFAGVMADADQAAGGPLGFVNPALYALDAPATASSAYYDVVPGGNQALMRVDYLNSVNAAAGVLKSVRVLDYEGPEVYCSGTGQCSVQNVALTTTHGFDSMTGIGAPGTGLVGDLAAAAG